MRLLNANQSKSPERAKSNLIYSPHSGLDTSLHFKTQGYTLRYFDYALSGLVKLCNSCCDNVNTQI
jgi:hypothetical protein